MSSYTTPLAQRTIALAALTQAVYLVDCIARKGVMDAEDCKVLMESMFPVPQTTEHDISQLYGGISGLTTGLRICTGLLNGSNLPQAKALMIYSAGLMTLERRLAKNTPMCHKLAEGMQRITHQKQYFGDSMHNNIIAAIAGLYGETISTMKPRIIVHGKTEYLSQTGNTQRVRALLMSGLHAAHLWHKHGGSRLNLLLRRKALLHELEMVQHLT